MFDILGVFPRLVDEATAGLTSKRVVQFTRYERSGVIVMAVAGVLSCVFVSLLLVYILISAVSHWSKPRKAVTDTVFTNTQIAVFLTCLLISDLIQSIAGITQVKWARENQIYDGRSCVIQAATLVMGDLGSTVWSSVMAVQTFSSIALGKHWPRWVVWTIVVFGWLFVVLLTFVAPLGIQTAEKGPYFSIAGTWCFISSEYAVARLVIHYIPLFIAAGLIIIFYGVIFLFLRGTVGSGHLPTLTAMPMNDVLNKQRVAIAKRMLWYPIGYFMCIIPIAVTRLIGLKDEEIPEPVWIFDMFFLFFLGTVDSVIYATTRKVVKPINLPFHVVSLSDHMRSNTHSHSNTPGIDLNILDGKRQSEHWAYKRRSVDVLDDMDDLQGSAKGIEVGSANPTSPGGGIQVTLERIQEVM